MAVFTLSADEYARFRKDLLSQPKKSYIKKALPYIVLLGLIILSFILGQYAFAGVIILLAIFIFWSIGGGQEKEAFRKYKKSRFLNNEIFVEFSDRMYKVRMVLNKLNLAVTDLSLVRALSESYCLMHKSGIELFIPYRALSDEEKGFLEKYRQRFDDNYRDQT